MSEVRASHIILKHTGSRNPVCRRTGATISRTPAEAEAQLTELRKSITPGNFADVASKTSECSSFRNGGDLGFFGPGMMDRNFEAATYNLKVGEISGVVSSASGHHLIFRTA